MIIFAKKVDDCKKCFLGQARLLANFNPWATAVKWGQKTAHFLLSSFTNSFSKCTIIKRVCLNAQNLSKANVTFPTGKIKSGVKRHAFVFFYRLHLVKNFLLHTVFENHLKMSHFTQKNELKCKGRFLARKFKLKW